MGYEVNQLFVAESFQALYLERGRPTVSRAELEARHDLCEDLAQSLSETCLALRLRKDLSPSDILKQVHSGLLQPPSALPAPEARWIAIRTAELLQWDVSHFLQASSGVAAGD